MEEDKKRIKITSESNISDIADSIDHIAQSIESLGEVHRDILRINRAVVTYLNKTEKLKKESLDKTKG